MARVDGSMVMLGPRGALGVALGGEFPAYLLSPSSPPPHPHFRFCSLPTPLTQVSEL